MQIHRLCLERRLMVTLSLIINKKKRKKERKKYSKHFCEHLLGILAELPGIA